MRNKIHLVFLLVGLSLSLGYAQQDTQKVTEEELHRMGQDLIDLLDENRYFEAKDLHDTLRMKTSSIHPFFEYYYRMKIGEFENKPDSVAFYLDEMMKVNLINDPENAYVILWEIYAEILQDYKKAYQTLDRAESYLNQNPDSLSPEKMNEYKVRLNDLKNQTGLLASEPTIRIVRENRENCTPLLTDMVLQEGYLFFNVSYNGHKSFRTLFDTGVTEYVLIDKAIAEQVGVRKYAVQGSDSMVTVNKMKVPGYLGILDSLQIGNVKLYYIPVGVFDMRSMINVRDLVETDSMRHAITGFYDASKVILGLKTMSLLEKIVIDFDHNQLCFPIDYEEPSGKKYKNMFRFYNQLFTQLKINNLPIMTFVDSGSNRYMDINTRFYEKHKALIPIEISISNQVRGQIMMGRTRNIPFDIIADDPVIMFNNKPIEFKKGDNVRISSFAEWGETYPEMVESTVGFPFLKRLGKKILFDFRNMRMEVLE